MIFLTKRQIVIINRLTISAHGGNFVSPDNFLHESSLDYLVDIVNAELFGEKMYPEIYHQAGVYLFNIISNHIFTDGNKRTGLGACLAFLKLNRFKLHDNISDALLTDFILSVASAEQTLESVQTWLKNNIVSK